MIWDDGARRDGACELSSQQPAASSQRSEATGSQDEKQPGSHLEALRPEHHSKQMCFLLNVSALILGLTSWQLRDRPVIRHVCL